MTARPTVLFAMTHENLPRLFSPRALDRLRELTEIDACLVVDDFRGPDAARALASTEVLITSWGAPPIDQRVLDAAPRLRAVLHAAGTVRGYVTDACWERGLLVSSAAEANAIPVAEYTLAAILLAGKNAFALRESFTALRGATDPDRERRRDTLGNHHRRVGVIGASRVGRRLLELLRPFDFELFLSDPYIGPTEATDLGAVLLSLDDLLRSSDIVTLHAPDLPATRGMLDRRRLALIPDGATVINTSRGTLIEPEALTDELLSGRLNAILDVTDPEPPPPDSPLYRLPNVFLTPHIAGSLGNELSRIGDAVVQEVERLAGGRPLEHRVVRADLERVA
ncbi:D-isomer specific 2-hydroxyacid dehydrogenase NAD-binding [Catenulispora acidiphila DSM 44928]|uniref:D-isomer specific 2-hydroxyacid dehydrogenase NAD-binding n=1 Tax=Catenulispora acidiphila (strain DSM 44928 / JCM 14897 / NBRC 102108 / NRRL B-24433 / ID139908) TaxID=479433 RepID=C7QBE6_CATAD|nr:hydroxyacid dehydrogenase [Catenulispora acidiphila]ACU70523.1 D-isomer specific 2-hydroxyacid dehydrogenase NAD-binding [Catenulispora acidiphila DSM 44928]